MVHYKFILIFLLSQITFGQVHPDSRIDSLLQVGIEKILFQEYDSAVKSFNDLNEMYSENPLGNIYLAATEITKSVDYAEELNEDLVDSLLSEAKIKTENLLEYDDENIWYNYYEALIYGYKAYYYSISGNLISAFADGVLSLRSFQNCLEYDNNFYEAYIALGSYKYWKSAQSKSFLWLPFVSDNRDEGIEFLEKSINEFSYNKHLAEYSLIWIYIDYEELPKAIDLGERMLTKYENSRFYRWALANAYQKVDKMKAIHIFNEILESLENLPDRNYYNDIVLRHKIAMLRDEMGDFEIALNLCNEILEFDLKSDKIINRLSDRIERTKILKEEILEKINDH